MPERRRLRYTEFLFGVSGCQRKRRRARRAVPPTSEERSVCAEVERFGERNGAAESGGFGYWRESRDWARDCCEACAGWGAGGYRLSFEQDGGAADFASVAGTGRGVRGGGDGY